MEEEKKMPINGAEDADETKVPQTVIDEKDDQPAANNIKRTIIIAIVILLIVYIIYEIAT